MQWHEIYNAENVEVATDTFIQKLVLEIHLCTYTKKIPRGKIKRTKWITPAIVNSDSHKNEIYLLFHRLTVYY